MFLHHPCFLMYVINKTISSSTITLLPLTMRREEREQKEKPFALYFVLGILAIVSIMSILSFTNPEILIGWYLDDDIRSQLTNLHERAMVNWTDSPSVDKAIVNARFTFDNDELVHIRVPRAIDTFNELFEEYDRSHVIIKNDDETLLELRWNFLNSSS